MSQRSLVFKGTLIYTVASYATQIFSLVRSFAFAAFLTPAQLGILGTAQLILEYGQFLSFGIHNALDREYPMLIARDRTAEAEFLVSFCLKAFLFLSVLAILLTYFALAGMRFRDQSEIFDLVLSLAIGFQLLAIFSRFYLRASQDYFGFSLATFLVPTVSVSIIFIFRGGLTLVDAVLSIFAGMLVASAYALFRGRIRLVSIRPMLNDKGRLGSFVGLSLYLLVYNGLSQVFTSIDRAFGSVFLPSKEFGYYTFGMYVIKGAAVLPLSFSTILYPAILRKLSTATQKDEILGMMRTVNAVISTLTPLIIIGVVGCIGFVLHSFLPKYEDSYLIILLAIPSIYFLTLPISCTDVLLGRNKQNLLTFWIFVLTIVVSACYLFLHFAHLLDGVTLAEMASFGSLLYGTLFFFLAYKEYLSSGEAFSITMNALKPFVILVVSVSIYVLIVLREKTLRGFEYASIPEILEFIPFSSVAYLVLVRVFAKREFFILKAELSDLYHRISGGAR